jgi:hypothetical protein
MSEHVVAPHRVWLRAVLSPDDARELAMELRARSEDSQPEIGTGRMSAGAGRERTYVTVHASDMTAANRLVASALIARVDSFRPSDPGPAEY